MCVCVCARARSCVCAGVGRHHNIWVSRPSNSITSRHLQTSSCEQLVEKQPHQQDRHSRSGCEGSREEMSRASASAMDQALEEEEVTAAEKEMLTAPFHP